MELKIKKSEFLNLLRWFQGIIDRRGTMPILSNLLLEARLAGPDSTPSDGLRISATDLEVALVASVGAEVKKGGRAVVQGRHLYEIVREAPEEEIRLSAKGEGGIEVASGKSRFCVVGMRPEDFPSFSTPTGREEIELDKDDLGDMIEKTFYAASADETRYTLNSLYFTRITRGEKEILRLVATDGHRLSFTERGFKEKVGGEKTVLGKGVIVPRKGINEIKKILAEGEGEIKMTLDEKTILVRRGGVLLSIRLVEGEFPNYEQVIPKKSDRVVSVARGAIVGALRRAAIMTTGEGRGVKFAFSPGRLEISASHPDLGEAVEEVEVDYKGPSFHVGFNPRYFLDILNVLEDEKVVLELKDEVSPCLIRSEFDRRFLALVMPMRI